MPVITSISLQKTKTNRYSLFVDDQFKIGIPEDTLIAFRLKKGLFYSDELHQKIIQHSLSVKLYRKALHFLSYSIRSEYEVREKLKTAVKELPENTSLIDTIIERLKKERYIDDAKFVDAFIQNNFISTKKGPFALKTKLLQKGVSESLIQSAIEKIDATLEHETALKIAEKYIHKQKNQSAKKMLEKTKMHLIQKGYSFQTIINVLLNVTFEQDANHEIIALETQLEKIGKKYKKKYTENELPAKLFHYLYQKGFHSSDIKEAISKYLN